MREENTHLECIYGTGQRGERAGAAEENLHSTLYLVVMIVFCLLQFRRRKEEEVARRAYAPAARASPRLASELADRCHTPAHRRRPRYP